MKVGRTPLFAVMAGIVVVIMLVQGITNWLTLLFAVPLLLILFGFGLYTALKQQMAILSSVKIEIGENYVARSQLRVPPVRITRADITSVEEIEGGLCVRTSDPARSLAVPQLLGEAEFQEIKATLAGWHPIKPNNPQARAKSVATYVVLLAGFGVIFFSESLWLVLATAVVVFAYYVYLYRLLRRSSGVDPQYKRTFLIILVFIVLITLSKLIFLLPIL